jgi:hypothetical protein
VKAVGIPHGIYKYYVCHVTREKESDVIIRSDKSKDYTTIANFALNDPTLSLKAKGLWSFIMTKPDNWKINYRGLATQLKEGKDAILAALKELEDSGYLVRGTVRNNDGKFETGDATLYEKPRAGNPGTVNQRTKVTTEQVNTDKVTSTNVEGTSSLLAPIPKQTFGNPEVSEIIQSFEKTMEIKLNRVTYQRRAASTLIKRYGKDVVLQGIAAAAACTEDQYAPHISSLEELQDKWNKLIIYYRKKKGNNKSNVVDLDDL